MNNHGLLESTNLIISELLYIDIDVLGYILYLATF